MTISGFQDSVSKRKEASLPVRAAILFEMFPFCMLFMVTLFPLL
jgi:hypothetical protein